MKILPQAQQTQTIESDTQVLIDLAEFDTLGSDKKNHFFWGGTYFISPLGSRGKNTSVSNVFSPAVVCWLVIGWVFPAVVFQYFSI